MQNLSYEDELNFHESESSGGTHFRMNGFIRRLVLTETKLDWEMAYYDLGIAVNTDV